MISHSRKTSGFTLIELLIVLAISMTAVGLVGGLSVDYMVKYKAKAEVSELKGLLTQAKNLAFISEQPLSIQLTEHKLYINRQEKTLVVKSFEKIQFSSLTFYYSALGLPSQKQLKYFSHDNYYILNLMDLGNAL